MQENLDKKYQTRDSIKDKLAAFYLNNYSRLPVHDL